MTAKPKYQTRIPYDNCQVLDIHGKLMFFCDKDKAKWYLNRNLAEKKQDNPLTVRLLFETKGVGCQNDPFGLIQKENKCVVCGKIEDLTGHHIVPRRYRKYFPKTVKSHRHHDIVALCGDCHGKYEHLANKLVQKLIVEYNAPLINIEEMYQIDFKLKEKGKAVRASCALIKYAHKIPPERIKELTEDVKKFLGQDEISTIDLKKVYLLSKGRKKTEAWYLHGHRVVSQVKDLQAFVVRWRQHFLDTMKPKFMPKFWDVNRDIFRKD